MTVEEIMKIRNQEEQGKLSLNSIASGKSQKQLENEYFVMNGIYSIINGQENIKSMWLKPNLIGKIILRTHGVKKYAYDKKDEAYFVKSKFGSSYSV